MSKSYGLMHNSNNNSYFRPWKIKEISSMSFIFAKWPLPKWRIFVIWVFVSSTTCLVRHKTNFKTLTECYQNKNFRLFPTTHSLINFYYTQLESHATQSRLLCLCWFIIYHLSFSTFNDKLESFLRQYTLPYSFPCLKEPLLCPFLSFCFFRSRTSLRGWVMTGLNYNSI